MNAWEFSAGMGLDTLPPDLVSSDDDSVCNEIWRTRKHAWSCTRRPGHTGRHAAGTGERIVAVWP